uniref:Alpha integrin subunit SU2 n=1 Tax=Lytechinus variegatus TaxID=7654 RepID=O76378_LYTVA|nr:alpha integrin subunit SU2 [Lytechinus variegatus]
MARILLLSFYAILLLDSTAGFNFDLRAPLKFDGPDGSMFGFSVAQHRDGNTDWALVGAPEASTNQSGVTKGGAVYSVCRPLSGPSVCEQIPFDKTGNINNVDKSNQWFGATVASGGANGQILACAPRLVWVETASVTMRQEREPTGTCFVGDSDFTNFVNYSPCQSTNREDYGFDKITHCQAGFSGIIFSDNSALVMGAPGSYYLQGQIYVQSLLNRSVVQATQESNTGTYSFDNSYRGYSLALGDFNGDGVQDYVVGTPRAESLMGLVAIFDQNLNQFNQVMGTQIVAYFGYSVTVVDINNDTYDDLLVGAPMYMDDGPAIQRWEAGAVYVYLQNPDVGPGASNRLSLSSTLIGGQIRSRFGLSIASIGDSNQDGFNDVAIGAPYEGDDAGAVYIYHGSANGLKSTPAQVLTPSTLGHSGITTFGFSLQGGQDMDKNKYPDLLVGAESANTAVLIRTRPVVSLDATLNTEPIGINLENKTYELADGTMVTSFIAMTCFTYTGNYLPDHIDISYTVTVDSGIIANRRAMFVDNDMSEITKTRRLAVSTQFCDPLRAYVGNSIEDKLTPIKVTLQYDLNNDESRLQPHEILPIIDMATMSTQTKQVSIQNNCVNNICIPDLDVTVTPNLPNIVIGQTQELTLDVSLNNRGEDAFQSSLSVYYPLGLQFVRLERKANMDFSVTCSEDSDLRIITCDTGNPMVGKNILEFGLTLSTFQVSGDKDSIEFYFKAESENSEDPNTLENNELNMTVPVTVDCTLKLLSASYPEIVMYSTQEDYVVPPFPAKNASEADIGMEVMHLYEVRNTGSSNAGEVSLNIQWPQKNEDGEYLFYLLGIMTEEGVTCQLTQGKANPEGVKLEPSTKAKLSNSTTQVSGRKRREPEVAEALAQTDNVIYCASDSCVLINCTIDEINASKSKVVRILGRFWERTFQKAVSELTPVVQATIASSASAAVKTIPYNIPLPRDFSDSTKASTLVTTEELVPPVTPIAWWIIVVSVLGGIILLLIIILGLWKCGFFERKKPGEEKEYAPVASADKDGPPSDV